MENAVSHNTDIINYLHRYLGYFFLYPEDYSLWRNMYSRETSCPSSPRKNPLYQHHIFSRSDTPNFKSDFELDKPQSDLSTSNYNNLLFNIFYLGLLLFGLKINYCLS